jgi:NAD(P)-dependent dehydrogenase (short-subunit alcohol dehydrogenase family)
MARALLGKVALVTGGNSGIGEATVHRLAEEGAHVVIVARRQAEGGAVEQAVRAAGGEATFVTCDVMERPAVEAAVAQAVALYGGLHILFNNAGGGLPHLFQDAADAVWEKVLRLNLLSTYMVTQVAWPHLVRAGGGSIVNMSSTTAAMAVSAEQRTLLPRIPGPAYGAAKAAVEAYTRYTAAEGSPHGIRCNAVRPGQIVTPATTRTTPGHHFAERYFAQVQLTPGPGAALDVANAVFFLASDQSRFINGKVLDIDGGAISQL